MFLAVLFMVPKIRNKCQPIDEWVNNGLSIQCNTSWQWKGTKYQYIQQYGWIPKILCWVRDATNKGVHIEWLHFCEVLEPAALICSDSNEASGCLGIRNCLKGHKGIFCGDGKSRYLDCGGGLPWCIYLLKLAEFCALNECILLSINYTSIKLINKKNFAKISRKKKKGKKNH